MKASIAKALCFIFALSVVLSMPCFAQGNEINIDIPSKAEAVYLYSYAADRVLFSSGEDKLLPPGPTVKIMTGLIACERLCDRLAENITITENMIKNVTGNSMGLRQGMNMSIRDLLYGAICGGNNDAAQALAVICSGSINDFVDEMNTYAGSIFMRKTKYFNPTGLDVTGAITTLEDTARLCRSAADNPLYMEISSAKSYNYTVNGATATIYNRNALISQFSSQGYINTTAKGLIAGSTDMSGFVLATTAQKNDSKYLCIVLGAKTDADEIYSYHIANKLINYAQKNYSLVKIAQKGDIFGSIKVNGMLQQEDKSNIECIISEDLYAFLPNDVKLEEDITLKPYYHSKEINAPVEQDEVVGGVYAYYNDVLVGEVKLLTASKAEANFILSFLEEARAALTGRVFIIFVLLLIPSVLAYVFVIRTKLRHKNVRTVQYKKFY